MQLVQNSNSHNDPLKVNGSVPPPLNETHKITVCRGCSKTKTVARESGLCTRCADKLVRQIIAFLCTLPCG